MATSREENIKIAEIAAEILKELIKAHPKNFDGISTAKNYYKEIFDAIEGKVGK